jgi:bifunctional non-homologous end joining protein LigD
MHSLHLPNWIQVEKIEHEERSIYYLLVQDESSLEYAVNLGTIEFHPFHSRVGHADHPDYFVLDLDPEDLSFNTLIDSANIIHQLLNDWKIPHYCKTSGARGLHMYIPLHAQYTQDQVSKFGQILGTLIHQELPKITSLERSPEKRQKKIYLDVLQNRAKQTIVAPYSLRGRPFAPVSTPLHWDELKRGLKVTDFTIRSMSSRLKEVGEIFHPVLGKGFNMKKWAEKLTQ